MLDLNEIYFMDCLEGLPLLPEKSVKLVIGDPPYGTTRCPWDIVIPFDRLWPELKRVAAPTAAVLVFAQTPFDKVAGASNLPDLRYEWIWEKSQATGHLNAKKAPMKAHENILVFYKKEPTFNPQMTTGHERKVSTAKHKRNTNTGAIYGKSDNHRDYDSTERYPRSALKFPSDKQKSRLHPTQKPFALIEYFVKTYTNPGDLVLDFCAGSGTTAVVCELLGRPWICFENDPENYQIAINRILG